MVFSKEKFLTPKVSWTSREDLENVTVTLKKGRHAAGISEWKQQDQRPLEFTVSW